MPDYSTNAIALALLAHVAVVITFILTAMGLWMAYGKLRCFPFTYFRRERRTLGLAAFILATIVALIIGAWLLTMTKIRPTEGTGSLLVGGLISLILLLGIAATGMLVYVWSTRYEHVKKARTASLVGACIASTGVVLVFTAILVTAFNNNMQHAMDPSTSV